MNRAIDLKQLRYFIAVAEESSFRRAAERLHLTQPPLSRQIGELERQLGVGLLARNTRSVQLTAAGQVALREFRRVVRDFDQAVTRVMHTVPAAPRLRFGMLYWSDMRALAAFEAALVASGAVSAVETVTLTSNDSIAAIRRGDLDAALVVAPIELSGLPAEAVGTVRHVAVLPARHLLARRRRVSLLDLAQITPFYRFKRGQNPPLFDHFDRQYQHLGFAPRKTAPAQGALGMMSMIAAGRGCSIMPEPIVSQLLPGVVARPLKEEVTVDLALTFSPLAPESLREALRKAVRSLLPRAAGARHAAPKVRSLQR